MQRSLRRGVCWNGLILDDQGSIIAQCSMTDVSASGAKLVMGAGINVPDLFVLTLARNAAVRRNCVVVWRAATSIGVLLRRGVDQRAGLAWPILSNSTVF